MQVKKISDKEILCIVSEEELYFDYDLEIEEILKGNRNNLKDVFLEIISKAAISVQFEPSGALCIEASINKKNELILHGIIINDDEQPIENKQEALKDYLKDLLSTLVQNHEPKRQDFKEFLEQTYCKVNSKGLVEYIIEIPNLNDVIEFVKISNFYDKDSTLYKLNDKFYLVCNHNEIYKNIISEFNYEIKNSLFKFMLQEHGKIIIKENAIEKLLII